MTADRLTLPFRRPSIPDPARQIANAVPIPDPVAFARAMLQLQDIGSPPTEIVIAAADGRRVAIDLTATATRDAARGLAERWKAE